MLIFIAFFILINIIVGLLAARMVHNTEDYLLAGRRLPLYIVTATLFATWFGSETILGASSEFATGGLIAVVRDPFGAALCLLLVGLFYARPMYRMKLLTLGDFFRDRYGKMTEMLAGICIILTYLAWIAAQMVAFGIILNALTGITLFQGIIGGALVVTFYTWIGGMWSVTITDFVQLIFILTGMIFASIEIFGIVSFSEIFALAPDGFFRFCPDPDAVSSLNYLAAWMTIGLGSIAGQDVFQRVMSSRSEKVAVRAPLISAFMYLTVAMIPLLLALAARTLNPAFIAEEADSQMIIPHLINEYASPVVQVMLFGGLLSAILSTASSAMLAPAAIFSENIIKPRLGDLTDRQLLWTSRLSVLVVSAIAIALALLRGNIYELVGEAASVGLVSLFVPLTAGLFWKKATTKGALASIVGGLLVWLIAIAAETALEPILYGLTASAVGMALGSLYIGRK